MKKILIMTALLASGVILSGCGETKTVENAVAEETQAINVKNTGMELIESTGTIESLSGANTTSNELKLIIEKRKTEMLTETGNEKEINEKDIALLESVLNKLSKEK